MSLFTLAISMLVYIGYCILAQTSTPHGQQENHFSSATFCPCTGYDLSTSLLHKMVKIAANFQGEHAKRERRAPNERGVRKFAIFNQSRRISETVGLQYMTKLG